MSKFTAADLREIKSIDLEEDAAKSKVRLAQKDLEIMGYRQQLTQMKAKIIEYEKALQQHEIVAAEKKAEDLKQRRRDLLKSYAKKYKVKSEVWGYDPETGEIKE